MKTSVFNGENLSSLEFNQFIRYRPSKKISFTYMEKECIRLLNNTGYEYGYYVWEKDNDSPLYHSHILIKNNFDFIETLYKNVRGYSRIKNGQRTVLMKIAKDENNSDFVDTFVDVPFYEFNGLSGTIHMEMIQNNRSSSFYTTKFTDRGINSGYIINCF